MLKDLVNLVIDILNWSPRRYKMSKPQQLFLKRGESIENEKLLLNLSDIDLFFSRIEGIFSKIFFKKTISIVGINLDFLGGCIR